MNNVGLLFKAVDLAMDVYKLNPVKISKGVFKGVLNIKNAISFVDVKQNVKNKTIEVSGINTAAFFFDLHELVDTTRVANNMFDHVGRHSFTFNSFYAVDVLFILRWMLDQEHLKSTRRSIEKLHALMEENTWLADINNEEVSLKFNYAKLSLFKKTALDHQMRFIQTYEKLVPRYGLKGYLLAAAPGAGKTINSLMLMELLDVDIVIVICPKVAVDTVWEKTIDTELTQPRTHYSAVNGGPKTICRYYIYHYDAMGKLLEFLKSTGFGNAKVGIILDESHNLNEKETLRVNLFVEICNRTMAKGILWMSGTAFKAMGTEAIPFLRTIDDTFDQNAEDKFKKIFRKNAGLALNILANRIGLVTFKVETHEFKDDKPIENLIKVVVPNGNDYTLKVISNEMSEFVTLRLKWYKENFKQFRDVYDEALKLFMDKRGYAMPNDVKKYHEYVSIMSKGFDARTMGDMAVYCNKFEKNMIIPTLPRDLAIKFKNAKSVIKYTELKVRGEALGRILTAKRVKCHVDMVKHAPLEELVDNASKKTLIFTSYVEVIKALMERFGTAGYVPLAVYGETNDELFKMVNRFDKEEDVNPLCATYKSLSTAVPLHMANNIILIDPPFRDYILKQTIARAHRLGQDSLVHVNSLQLDTGHEANISTRTKDILEWSKEQVAIIMGRDIESIGEVTLESFNDSEGMYKSVMDEVLTMENLEEVEITMHEYVIDTTPVWASW